MFNDAGFLEAERRDRFDIYLYCQPPNTPQYKCLGSWFFRAIDAFQHQESPNMNYEFIAVIEHAFKILLVEDLNNIFLTLQSFTVKVMKAFGG